MSFVKWAAAFMGNYWIGAVVVTVLVTWTVRHCATCWQAAETIKAKFPPPNQT